MKMRRPVIKISKLVMEIVLGTMRKQLGLTVLMLLVIAGTIVTGIIPPLVLGQIVDCLTDKTAPVITMVLIYFGFTVAAGLFDASKESLITIFGQKVTHEIRSRMCEKINRMPTKYFVENEPGMITSRMVNDVNTVENLFESGIISMFVDVCKVISVIVVIFAKSKGLGVLLVIVTPFLFMLTRAFQSRMLKAQIENRIAVGEMNQQIPETITNLRTIHVFQKEKYMENRYDKSIQRSFKAMEQSNFYDAIYSPIIVTTSAFVIAVMMVLSAKGGDFQSCFGMTVGTAVAVISYVGKIFDPLENIGMEIQNIQSAVAGIKRIEEFLLEEEKGSKTSEYLSEKKLNNLNLKGNNVNDYVPAVSFEDVTFGYDMDRAIFDDFSMKIETGENVTISGRTGIGKSTLFKLILGLYVPNSGEIRIYGVSPEQIPDTEKRSIYGYVEQNFKTVPGTILEQISLKDESITDDMVKKALQLVGMKEEMEHLKNGLDTMYEDTFFSQGQLQLLSIARAIVADPKLLLLDEITANLDSITEKRVLAALKAASDNRTVISISHRLYEQTGGRKIEF